MNQSATVSIDSSADASSSKLVAMVVVMFVGMGVLAGLGQLALGAAGSSARVRRPSGYSDRPGHDRADGRLDGLPRPPVYSERRDGRIDGDSNPHRRGPRMAGHTGHGRYFRRSGHRDDSGDARTHALALRRVRVFVCLIDEKAC